MGQKWQENYNIDVCGRLAIPNKSPRQEYGPFEFKDEHHMLHIRSTSGWVWTCQRSEWICQAMTTPGNSKSCQLGPDIQSHLISKLHIPIFRVHRKREHKFPGTSFPTDKTQLRTKRTQQRWYRTSLKLYDFTPHPSGIAKSNVGQCWLLEVVGRKCSWLSQLICTWSGPGASARVVETAAWALCTYLCHLLVSCWSSLGAYFSSSVDPYRATQGAQTNFPGTYLGSVTGGARITD
jgi:hypothetical protein